MRNIRVGMWLVSVGLLSGTLALGQVEEPSASENLQESAVPAATVATLPRLIRVRGTLHDETGKPVSGVVPVTFALYKDQNSIEAVWQETQNARVDAAGNFSVLLGATKEEGLPLEIFNSGEARWLGVQPEGQTEQPRVLLLAVAYALKAADAETLGGQASFGVCAGGKSILVADNCFIVWQSAWRREFAAQRAQLNPDTERDCASSRCGRLYHGHQWRNRHRQSIVQIHRSLQRRDFDHL